MKIEPGQLSKHFKTSEFRCHCCGKCIIVPELIISLEALRSKVNTPIRINSGYRCEKHNKEIKGSKTSYHMRGMAADIRCRKDKMPQLLDESLKIFKGVIEYSTWIHVDVRDLQYHKTLSVPKI